jgi:lipopolysaccharide transport system ATP-binding protein
MSDIVLKVENLSKLYRLGEVGTGTLSHDLNRWFARVRGKEDPFSKVGEINDRTSGTNSKNGFVWSLKDINFDIRQGDVVGIIGKNGAGKSTLLKLISQITAPTTGSIKAKGRIASLLEVGTGMHPEMTGRENIYLNGTILGMRKWEIDRKFDEIVDFAGCAKYVDTPIKRYSSGMKVRLGFAVAAFLEPEILIVDEVLAVGDAEFQKKAIGKMQDVSKSEGRTVLFVSHNMTSIRQLCNVGVLLDKGRVKLTGSIDEIVKEYEKLAYNEVIQSLRTYKRQGNLGREVYISDIVLYNELNEVTDSFHFQEQFYFDLSFCGNGLNIDGLNIGVRIETSNDVYITSCLSMDSGINFSINEEISSRVVRVNFHNLILAPGDYFITLSIRKGGFFYDQIVKAKKITIHPYGRKAEVVHNGAWGVVMTNASWEEIN